MQRLGRNVAQAFRGGAELAGQQLGVGGRVAQRHRHRHLHRGRAQQHRALEAGAVGGVLRQQGRVLGAARLPHHGDVARIAAERGDVLPHPLQRGAHVLQLPVGEAAVGGIGEVRMRQQAQHAQAVVHGDDDHAALGQRSAVHQRHARGAGAKAPAVQPHDDGALAVSLRRPDVEREAVFALLVLDRVDPRHDGTDRLDARGTEAAGIRHAGRGLDRLRSAKAQRTDRRLRIGDAEVAADRAIELPTELARRGADHEIIVSTAAASPQRGDGNGRTSEQKTAAGEGARCRACFDLHACLL